MWGLNQSDIKLIRELFSKYPAIKEAVIFGSRAKKTQRSGSDVDIALKGKNLNDTVLEVSAILNQESPLPYFFDIIDYKAIDNLNLKSHIDRVGNIIYSRKN